MKQERKLDVGVSGSVRKNCMCSEHRRGKSESMILRSIYKIETEDDKWMGGRRGALVGKG